MFANQYSFIFHINKLEIINNYPLYLIIVNICETLKNIFKILEIYFIE